MPSEEPRFPNNNSDARIASISRVMETDEDAEETGAPETKGQPAQG